MTLEKSWDHPLTLEKKIWVTMWSWKILWGNSLALKNIVGLPYNLWKFYGMTLQIYEILSIGMLDYYDPKPT